MKIRQLFFYLQYYWVLWIFGEETRTFRNTGPHRIIQTRFGDIEVQPVLAVDGRPRFNRVERTVAGYLLINPPEPLYSTFLPFSFFVKGTTESEAISSIHAVSNLITEINANIDTIAL